MNTIELEINNRVELYLYNFFQENFPDKEAKSFYDLSFNSNNKLESYFSEIEINFWDVNGLLDFYSILIYVQGILQGSIDEIYIDAISEINQILKKYNDFK